MKNLKHYYFLLILVIFAQALSAQCPTSNFVRIKRQGQIDSFSINYPNCTNIPGSVVISTSNAYGCPSDIVNLDGLSQIESIHGNLVFRGTQLTNIDGLNNLTQVDGDLKIDYSCELARIDGLNGLLNINGDCKVSNCPKLSQISGFQNLKTIGKNLFFYGNYGLQGIDGFNSLYKINGHFEITNNGIENIGGFGQLTDIEGLLRIENNSNLVKIDGMINLTKIGRTLRLVRCPKLEDISGLENLGSVGENSSTYSYSEITNTHLSNLAGLIGLESIYGSLKVKGNDFLESLDGLENLTLTKKLMIENNRVLIDINGLKNVNPLLLKSISISDNPALNDCAIVPICTLLNQPNVSFFVVFNGIGCENLHNISVSCNGGICEEIFGFTWLGSYGGHGYYISDGTFPWQQAKTLAENAGGYLATMNDQAENDFLKNQLNGNMVFIGYNDETTEGIGQWADNEPVTLDLSYGNSDINDYGVMNFWDGGWQMTNGLGYRRFVLEKECGGVLLEHLNVIDFSCQSSFPTLDTAFEVTVTIKNEGGTPSLEKPLYFGQEYDFHGENMKTLGHFDVPALMPNETITLTKSFDISDAQLPGTYSVWPHLIDIAKTYTYGDFIVGFHSSYAPLSQYKYLDFYCKKFNTELSVEILGDTNSLDENGIFDYSLMVSNTGNETAYNVKVEYIEGLGYWPVLNSLFSRYNTSDHAYIYIPVLLAGESKQIHVEQKINDYYYPIPKEEHHISVVVSSGHNTNTLMATDTSSATFHLNPLDCGSIAGFTKLGEYNGHTYYQSNESAPWQQAKTLAENAGGYLATMNDQAENDFLKNQLNGNMVFIGYNDATTEGFGQWADNEPVTLDLSYGNSDINDYGVMNFWDGGWQMTNGLGYRKFVMEMSCGSTTNGDLTITCPQDIVVSTASTLEVVSWTPAVATTTCTAGTNTTVTQTAGAAPGSSFTVGTHTISYNATDLCNNSQDCSFTITVNSLNNAGCGNVAGFTKLGEFNGHGYYMSDALVPWAQAKTLAENAGGYLVTMNDQAENDFVKANLNNTMAFIGYHDATTEGVGQWTNNEPVTLDLSYGNNDVNDYAVMNFWDGSWQMNNGLGYRKFVMEKECGVLPPAKVKLVSVLCSQGYPYPDSTITLDIVVTNLGGVPSDSVEILFNQRASCSTSTVWAEYFINFGQFDVPSLNPMDTLVLTKSFTMTDVKVPGKYSPGCGHNGSGVWTYDDFTVGDLTLDYYCKKYSTDLSLKVESDSYVYGDDKEIHYDVTVTNNGLDTAYNFWVNTKGGSFYYRDANFGWENIYSLAPGASKTFMSHKKINWNHSPYTLSLNIYAGHNIDPNPGNDSVEVVFYYAGTLCDTVQGFTELGYYDNHTYYLSDASAPWQQAKTLAENAGGYLATMNDQAENDFVKANLNNTMVFIGYNDATTEDVGQWADNEPVTLDLSYGNSDVNDYGVMNFWDGGWQMTNGLGWRKFVMEMDCGSPQPTPMIQNAGVSPTLQIQGVYPNPAKDNITIRIITPEEKSSLFNVYDGRGQLLLSEKRDLPQGASEVEFDLSDLPAGMYFVKEAGTSKYYNFVIMR